MSSNAFPPLPPRRAAEQHTRNWVGHKTMSSSNFIIGVKTWKGSHDTSTASSLDSLEDKDLKAALEDELDHDVSPSELAELRSLQLVEVLTLQGTYGDSLDASRQSVLVFTYPEITLNIVTGAHYPRQPPTWEIEKHVLPRRVVDKLRMILREYLSSRIGDTSAKLHDRNFLLGLATTTTDYLISYRTKLLETPSTPKAKDGKHTIMGRKSAKPEEFADTAYSLLGQTLPQILVTLSLYDIRILHVETILRKDLGFKFNVKREQLREKFEAMEVHQLTRCIPKSHKTKRRKEDMVEELTRPRVTFHGTDAVSVPNIVRCGFLVPGKRDPITGDEHGVRCGSTYGRGIYTSPDPLFSHSYTYGEKTNMNKKSIGGRKLIVCAQLMGRSAVVSRDQRGVEEAIMAADSHVSVNQKEYVVFDPAMVLPCYVVHYELPDEDHEKFGNDEDDIYIGNSSNVNRLLSKFGPAIAPGDAQRQKAEIFARGSKWFPYGYGPATNGKFVIEDVAEIDDDEEDWGNYQEDRAAEGDIVVDHWGSPVGATDKDQYITQRMEKVKRKET